ncbi:MAG: MFS transporter [Verrucomicrobiae bacterium]|nr:MFS transporter [Verrucomicrobiae bacterium]
MQDTIEPQNNLAFNGTKTVEPARLRDVSPYQWRAGIAAWLGWLFDGLDMHLYTLVAAPFVMQLVNAASTSDSIVKEKSSWIQAAFLVGWAIGGGFFGRIGDVVGRSKALALTILTYACFTGLSSVAQTWWQLLIFRFIAALGIGGEWAVGASLLAETWPKKWSPWIAAVLQTGVNIGILFACLTVFLMAGMNPRYVFLVGVLPAFIVYWIRKKVPEPVEWQKAMEKSNRKNPPFTDLFHGNIRKITLLSLIVCACSLTAWWAFLFWNHQHLRNLALDAGWDVKTRERLVSAAFFLVIGVSIFGNFFAGFLAKLFGYKRAIAIMLIGFFAAMSGTYIKERTHIELLYWIPAIGFFSGVFGLFTMYLPPLFPTLLRTSGAGFCFNIGRISAAFGTVFFGLFSQVGNFRHALLYASFLFIPSVIAALFLPEHRDTTE